MNQSNERESTIRQLCIQADHAPILSANLRELMRKAAQEIEQLRVLLAEAAEDVESWGAYASPYFQKKHRLAECVQKFRQASEGQ